MYNFSTLGIDYNKCHGETADFEVAMERVINYQNWVIQRRERTRIVSWVCQSGHLRRIVADIEPDFGKKEVFDEEDCESVSRRDLE